MKIYCSLVWSAMAVVALPAAHPEVCDRTFRKFAPVLELHSISNLQPYFSWYNKWPLFTYSKNSWDPLSDSWQKSTFLPTGVCFGREIIKKSFGHLLMKFNTSYVLILQPLMETIFSLSCGAGLKNAGTWTQIAEWESVKDLIHDDISL